jgi:hypothetical protein
MEIDLASRVGAYLGREEGLALADALGDDLVRKKTVMLDFAGVEVSLPSFFNALFGRLAERLDVESIEAGLTLLNESDLQRRSWKAAARSARVTDADANRMWDAERRALLG